MTADAQLESLLRSNADAREVWPQVVAQLREQSTTPDDWRAAWDRAFARWDESTDGPRPLWFPAPHERDHSNLYQFMQATGQGSYQELYQWSIAQPNEFWQAVADQLGVVFADSPSSTLDLAQGATQPIWFPGGTLNIVESCFPDELGEAAAIVWGGPDLYRKTYAELRDEVTRVASALALAGFQPGDHIAIVMPMTPESVSIYLGIIVAGCVAVSIADSFAAPQIAKRLQIAEAKGVFCVESFWRAGRSIRIYERIVAAEAPRTIVLDSDSDTQLRAGDTTWQGFIDAGSLAAVPHLAEPSGHINILFSSGTTGDPKAIPWNHTTPIKAAADGFFHHDIRQGDVVVWPTNLGWMMGPWLIFASLMNRATIGLYADAPVGEGFGHFVQDAKVTMLGVVPTLVRSWRASRCMEACDWSAIRCFSSTGEASNADDMFYLSSLAGMKPIIEYCGGTEIGGGYITSSVYQPNAPAKFSTAAIGSGLVILDEAGQEADEGELFLIPPAMGLSTELLNRDHAATYEGTPAGPNGESLRRHGDHFRRLPGGFFVAGGRVDDTMNLGGIKVSSAEMERVLNRLDGVRESAAVAMTEQGGGPDTLAVFVVREAECPEADELQAAMNATLKAELNPLFRVSRVCFIDALPRTASNKVMRRKLRERL